MLSGLSEENSCCPNVCVNIWWVFHYVHTTMLQLQHMQPGRSVSAENTCWCLKCIKTRDCWRLSAARRNVDGMSYCDFYCFPDASWGFCIMEWEVQSELNADNVVYLNTSVRVGGMDVIHTRTLLLIVLVLLLFCFALGLLTRPSLATFHLPFKCTSLFCSLILFHRFLPHLLLFSRFSFLRRTRVCRQSYTLTPFCMTEVLLLAPSITTSAYPCQRGVRAGTAAEGGQ